MKILFWLSILVIFYVYLGYPVIVYLVLFVSKKPVKKKYIYPTISVIISAYNEGKNIENKIRNLLNLDYPKDKLEILIGSDGSTDRTDAIISKYINGKIKFFRHFERQGKPTMLNMLAREAKGEVFIFTDARQKLDKDSFKELVKNFSDHKVGSVSAELLFEKADSKTASGVALYWRYEKFIRNCESKIGSMLGATGALYAIRRELFPDLPRNLILDDVYIPITIIQKGYRAIFEPKAKVFDQVAKNAKEEFLRKTRTLAGNFQLFYYLKKLFNPFQSLVGLQFFSHKFLRLVVPFLLVIVFVINFFILDSYFYNLVFILQITFYTFACLGLIIKHVNRLFDVPCMFCVMNLAAVVGLYRFLTHKQDVLWRKPEENLQGVNQR